MSRGPNTPGLIQGVSLPSDSPVTSDGTSPQFFSTNVLTDFKVTKASRCLAGTDLGCRGARSFGES